MPENIIELGGRTFELCFTRYSIYRAAKETGEPYAETGKYGPDLLLWSCVIPKTEISFKEFCALLPVRLSLMEELYQKAAGIIKEAQKDAGGETAK